MIWFPISVSRQTLDCNLLRCYVFINLEPKSSNKYVINSQNNYLRKIVSTFRKTVRNWWHFVVFSHLEHQSHPHFGMELQMTMQYPETFPKFS